MIEVRVPLEFWTDEAQVGSVVVWLFPDGALVNEGDLIAEILVEKATVELYAPATGRLMIHVEPEVDIDRDVPVARILH